MAAALPATTTVTATATAVDPTTTALAGSTGIVPDSSAAVAGTVPADNLNPAVTQATIKSTICVSGFTKTIRPPVSFTDRLKVHQIASYGYADHSPGSYEEDHVVALGLGGAPSAPVNLWPEPRTVSGGDDRLENDLHAKVCSGALT